MREEVISQEPAGWVVRPDRDLEDLIPDFMQNRRNDVEELEGAIQRKDFVFIKRLGHTLKGICRPYGFIHLETVGRELEGAGEREDEDEVQQLLALMKRYLDNVQIVYDPEL